MEKSYLNNIFPLKVEENALISNYLSYRKNTDDFIYLFFIYF